MKEQLFGTTDTGRARTNNEDAFIAQQLAGQPFQLACVIDGVGGYEGGEVAAATACETILDYLSNKKGNGIQLLKEAVWLANKNIFRLKEEKKEWHQMACVLTLALIDEAAHCFHYAHVGDTRLYLFRDQSLVKITRDQSFVGFLEDSGRITEEAAMNHPKRNEINKALGFEKDIHTKEDYVETGTSPFLPGDQLLLCSDGLTDMLPAAAIIGILRQAIPLPRIVQQLIDAANEAGGKDNITVVVVRNNLPAQKHLPVVPAKPTTEPTADRPTATSVSVEKPEKKKSIGMWFVLICTFLLFAIAVWYLARDKKSTPPETAATQSMAAQMVQDQLNGSESKLVLSDSVYGQRVAIADTLLVSKDSLFVNGSGLVLINDAAFKGPALYFSGKNCILENMVFENFETAVIIEDGTLTLKNVQFKNCRLAVQYHYKAANGQPLNGSIQHRFNPDSIKLPNTITE